MSFALNFLYMRFYADVSRGDAHLHEEDPADGRGASEGGGGQGQKRELGQYVS